MASPRVFPDRRRPHRDTTVRDRGQATVEFALLLPLVVVLVLCLVQLAAVVSRRAALETTTWNLTRAATVAVDPAAAARAALDDRSIELRVTTDDRWVTVVARTVVDTDVPVVGRFFPAVTLESRLTMLLEPPLG